MGVTLRHELRILRAELDDCRVRLSAAEQQRNEAQTAGQKATELWWAAEARAEAAERRVKQLEDERKPGPMPNLCDNPECGTIRYGVGYTSCPDCGSAPRAALAGRGDAGFDWQARVEAAEQALRFYAAPATYEESSEPHPTKLYTGVVPIEDDCGALARAALAGREETGGG